MKLKAIDLVEPVKGTWCLMVQATDAPGPAPTVRGEQLAAETQALVVQILEAALAAAKGQAAKMVYDSRDGLT